MDGPALIALVGLPGSGKTSAGRALAELLGADFIDLDDYITEGAGMSVAAVFELRGEAGFRELESRALEELTRPRPAGARPTVLATGGGVVLREANRRALRGRCAVLWLDASPAVAAHRLALEAERPGAVAHLRPLLAGGDVETRLRELAAERRPLYEACASLSLAADLLPPEELAQAAAEALGAYRR